MNDFYVYEHWRPDTDQCFYVGKGRRRRAWCMAKRNLHHSHIVRKLCRMGLRVDIRIVASKLSEKAAYDLEMRRIRRRKASGHKLANKSDGGGGPSNMVVTNETREKLKAKRALRIFTPGDRAAMSAGRIGMKFTIQHRANLAAKKFGVRRKPFSDATIERMREAAKRREDAKRKFYGSQVRRDSRINELGI